ncbi:thioredoxin [Candidatus Pacearchaeota archaeon]|nr:thioredoxin [Candidatus Pacearchaeota archaeon]
MAGNIEVLTSKNFNSSIAKGSVIVDFYADWCGPCKIMAPNFEKASGKVTGVKFAKLNVDGAQDVAMNFGVMSIPTTIAFKNGKAVDMKVGALSENDIVKLAEKIK